MSDNESDIEVEKPSKKSKARSKKHEDSDDEKPVKKQKRTKKDKDAPKKGKTAFIIFSNETRPIVKKELPDLAFGDVAREIASRWKDADEATKKRCEKEAAKDKDRYNKEMESYKPSGGSAAAKPKGKKAASKKKAEKEESGGDDDGDDDDGDDE